MGGFSLGSGLWDALMLALNARPCPACQGDAGVSTHPLKQKIYFLWRAVHPVAEQASECPCWEGGARRGGAVYALCPSFNTGSRSGCAGSRGARHSEGWVSMPPGRGCEMLLPCSRLWQQLPGGVGSLCVNVRRVLHCSIWMPKLYSAVKAN